MCPRKKVSVAAVNDKNFDVILTSEDNLSVFMSQSKELGRGPSGIVSTF